MYLYIRWGKLCIFVYITYICVYFRNMTFFKNIVRTIVRYKVKRY